MHDGKTGREVFHDLGWREVEVFGRKIRRDADVERGEQSRYVVVGHASGEPHPVPQAAVAVHTFSECALLWAATSEYEHAFGVDLVDDCERVEEVVETMPPFHAAGETNNDAGLRAFSS